MTATRPCCPTRGTKVSEVAELKARLAVETSLKERAEQREEAERRERVATNAQLLAVETSKVPAAAGHRRPRPCSHVG